MIEIVCHSNLDNFTPTVTKMVAMPRIGDYVQCIIDFKHTALKICRIIHGIKPDHIPYLEIELTKC